MKLDELDTLAARLPRNPGINSGDEYFVSVVLLLLVPKNGEYQILFEKRASSIRQGGEISLPGGEYDANDGELVETALREAEEEVGIGRNRIRILGRLDSVVIPLGVVVHVFVGVTDVSEADIAPDSREVEKAFLVPVSYFQENEPEVYHLMTRIHASIRDETTNTEKVFLPSRELGLPERYWNSWNGSKHRVYVFKTSEGTIWGITSRIVVDFVKRLG